MRMLPHPAHRPTSSAVLSECGRYRYRLTRVWDETGSRVLWIMLNPSTADADTDDPTIRRCITFAKGWGYGGIEVVNLFALRSTNPRQLRTQDDPVGEGNLDTIQEAALDMSNTLIVCAWGAVGRYKGIGQIVYDLCRESGVTLHILEMGKTGMPCHPLYLSAKREPQVWSSSEPQ